MRKTVQSYFQPTIKVQDISFAKNLKINSSSDEDIIYPESDGKPMSDNTKQYSYIVSIKENLETIFQENVFIAADLFWYPVRGNKDIKAAPDVMVCFSRPKGDRRSYLQWNEDNIAPHVVFEILSHNNTKQDMKKKFAFYEQYNVQEYYIYDPNKIVLKGYTRLNNKLNPINEMDGYISPLLKIKFDLSGDELVMYRPDGKKFTSLIDSEQKNKNQRLKLIYEKQRADFEKQRAEKEKQRAEKEKQRAEKEKQRADNAELMLKQLMEKISYMESKNKK